MNKTPYDDWMVKLIGAIGKLIIKAEDMVKMLTKFKTRKAVNKKVEGYSKRIHAAETTPRGHWGVNYSHIMITLVDDYEKLAMEYASKLDVYLHDFSYLDLSDRVFYIKGKSAAARFLLKDDESTYRDTRVINRYIKSGERFEGIFFVSQVTKEEYKNAPDNKKLKIAKNGGV